MKKLPAANPPPPAPLNISLELLETLRSLLAQTSVSGEANSQQLLLPESEQGTNTAQEASATDEDEQGTNNGERVRAYLLLHPGAKVREVADALTISVSTANKWMSRVKA